jgi:hypothetical protein
MNKRSLIVMMLIGLLGFGMIFGGCENGTTPNNEEVVEPVVEEKYWGTWKTADNATIILTKTTYKLNQNSEVKAYTTGADLFANGDKKGTFQDDTHFLMDHAEDLPFIKQ